jgi:hypothetical protein
MIRRGGRAKSKSAGLKPGLYKPTDTGTDETVVIDEMTEKLR